MLSDHLPVFVTLPFGLIKSNKTLNCNFSPKINSKLCLVYDIFLLEFGWQVSKLNVFVYS